VFEKVLESRMNKPYHHGNLRAALLDAARARLAEAAEADLSLRDLAARVGVSVNATYRHFDSKEALLMELAALGFEALRTDLQAAIAADAHATADEKLQLAGEAYTAFAQRDPALFRLMFGRHGRFDEHARFRESAGAAFHVLVDCVAAVRGEAADAPGVMKAAVAAWSLVHGHAILGEQGHLQALPPAQRPSTREIAAMLDVTAC
jgi:AcrR family transcriptional regulator